MINLKILQLNHKSKKKTNNVLKILSSTKCKLTPK